MSRHVAFMLTSRTTGVAPVDCLFSKFTFTLYSAKLSMYYGSGTVRCCCICTGQMLPAHSPDGSTFLRELTSRPPSWKWSHISKADSVSRCVFS